MGSGRVRVMTLAPELPGALDVIELIAGDGSVAVPATRTRPMTRSCARRTPGCPRHAPLQRHERPPHREPGAAGALLSDGRLRTGVIADGIHVHPAAVRVAYRAKGAEGLALVTDAMEAAGMPDWVYALSGRASASRTARHGWTTGPWPARR